MIVPSVKLRRISVSACVQAPGITGHLRVLVRICRTLRRCAVRGVSAFNTCESGREVSREPHFAQTGEVSHASARVHFTRSEQFSKPYYFNHVTTTEFPENAISCDASLQAVSNLVLSIALNVHPPPCAKRASSAARRIPLWSTPSVSVLGRNRPRSILRSSAMARRAWRSVWAYKQSRLTSTCSADHEAETSVRDQDVFIVQSGSHQYVHACTLKLHMTCS